MHETCLFIGKAQTRIVNQGPHKKLQPFFKDFSKTFQGPHLILKDNLPGM